MEDLIKNIKYELNQRDYIGWEKYERMYTYSKEFLQKLLKELENEKQTSIISLYRKKVGNYEI